MISCPECGGVCEARRITLNLKRQPLSFVVVRDVPAEVCQRCGESHFSLETTQRIMTALQSRLTPDDILLTPIYNFDTVAD